jgi:hypothetical protein
MIEDRDRICHNPPASEKDHMPAGRSRTTTNKPYRDRPQVHFTLSPETIAVLDALAAKWNRSRSSQVETMVLEAAFKAQLDVDELGRREAKRRNKFGKLRHLEGKD